jgi:hypothetical protein
MQQRSAERNVGGLKQEALDTAGGAFQIAQLVFEYRESVLSLEDLLDRKDYPREFQKVVTDCFGDVKASFPEDAPEPYDIRRAFPGKIHEFHG